MSHPRKWLTAYLSAIRISSDRAILTQRASPQCIDYIAQLDGQRTVTNEVDPATQLHGLEEESKGKIATKSGASFSKIGCVSDGGGLTS